MRTSVPGTRTSAITVTQRFCLPIGQAFDDPSEPPFNDAESIPTDRVAGALSEPAPILLIPSYARVVPQLSVVCQDRVLCVCRQIGLSFGLLAAEESRACYAGQSAFAQQVTGTSLLREHPLPWGGARRAQ